MTKQIPNPRALARVIERGQALGHRKSASEIAFDPSDCRHFDIRIGRDGTWYYRGSPIARMRICRLFSSALRADGAGNFYLVTPAEQGKIDVDDAPFTAVELINRGEGRDQVLSFRTNMDQLVTVDQEHPIRVQEDPASGEPSPYVLVRDNLEALILRPQFYQLVDLAEERDSDGGVQLGVWSAGTFFPIGSSAEA